MLSTHLGFLDDWSVLDYILGFISVMFINMFATKESSGIILMFPLLTIIYFILS